MSMHSGDGALTTEQVVRLVRAETPELYRNWFEELGDAQIEGGELVIPVPDLTRAAYLRENCAAAFSNAAMSMTGRLLPVRFISTDGNRPVLQSEILSRVRLNPDYTFDQFVVGPSNRLAHAACRAVVNKPGTLYNPLFLHGHSGLGKSHLLQATCADILRAMPRAEVTYLSCEAFINDLVRALEAGMLQAFREEARRCDVLVLDDVQFLAERESPQEELFHTFNALYQSRRQIILSADLPPAEIPTLEDRLISRFNWGVVAQIDPPDRETRQAILQKKARLRGIELPADVIDLLVERCETNIRLLEGAISKLIVHAQASDGAPITLDVARELISTLTGTARKSIQINDILEAVSQHFKVKLSEIVGRKRTKSIVQPRQVGMYLARKLTTMSLEEIGAHFGGRDHATVLHADRCVTLALQNGKETSDAVSALLRKLSR